MNPEETTGYVLFERMASRRAVSLLHALAQEMAMEVESQNPDAYRAKSALRRWSKRLHDEADKLEDNMPAYFPYIEDRHETEGGA